jgi:hypothetical protein
MKAYTYTPKNPFRIILFAFVVMFATACAENDTTASDLERLEENKIHTQQVLVKFKIDLEKRIAYIDEELSTARGRIRSGLNEARTELETQKEIIESEISNVSNATLDNWNEVVENASQSIIVAKSKTNEVSRNVRAMLDA